MNITSNNVTLYLRDANVTEAVKESEVKEMFYEFKRHFNREEPYKTSPTGALRDKVTSRRVITLHGQRVDVSRTRKGGCTLKYFTSQLKKRNLILN